MLRCQTSEDTLLPLLWLCQARRSVIASMRKGLDLLTPFSENVSHIFGKQKEHFLKSRKQRKELGILTEASNSDSGYAPAQKSAPDRVGSLTTVIDANCTFRCSRVVQDKCTNSHDEDQNYVVQ